MWIDLGSGHRAKLVTVDGTTVRKWLWEHDTVQPYPVPRHMISNVDSATWQLVQREPLTLTPSVHCDRSRGGCGMHGFISNGRYA